MWMSDVLLYTAAHYHRMKWVNLDVSYRKAILVKMNKHFTISSHKMHEFGRFHWKTVFFFKNFNNEFKRGHENEARAGYGKLKIKLARPNRGS